MDTHSHGMEVMKAFAARRALAAYKEFAAGTP